MMRFLIDENLGPSVALWLAATGHDVASVSPKWRGMPDSEILSYSNEEDRILITCDKDFGHLVFLQRRPHRGVVFLRLKDDRPDMIVLALEKLFEEHAAHVAGRFVVVTDDDTRFASTA